MGMRICRSSTNKDMEILPFRTSLNNCWSIAFTIGTVDCIFWVISQDKIKMQDQILAALSLSPLSDTKIWIEI